ncbi:right-handed parallel beta-helix repeat-containing protein [Haladaptatus sp. NG-SE-30]
MRQSAAVVVSLLIVSSLFAVGTLATGSGSSDGVTEIDSCTDIESPGTYVLTEDIENSSTNACIDIRSSDVVLDGQGHTVDGEFDLIDGIVTRDSARTNVTVENVVVTDWQNGITLTSDESRLENVTVTNNAVGVVFRGTDDAVLADSTVSNNRRYSADGSGFGIRIVGDYSFTKGDDHSSNVTITGTVVSENYVGITASGSSHTIENSSITANGGGPYWAETGGIRLTNTTDMHVVGNEVEDNDLYVGPSSVLPVRNIVLRNNTLSNATLYAEYAPNTTIVGNHIRSSPESGIVVGEDASDSRVVGNVVQNTTDGVRIATAGRAGSVLVGENVLHQNEDGVEVYVSNGSVRILGNQLVNNTNGVRIGGSYDNADNTEIHRNVIAGNEKFGVLNKDNDVVDATRNDWGASNGPSSVDSSGDECEDTESDGSLEDPITGRLADDDGDAVSAGLTAGVSNVHFDPWLSTDETDAGDDGGVGDA